MPNNKAKPAGSSISRRSSSKSSGKRVSIGNETVYTLSSDEHSQDEAYGDENDGTDFENNQKQLKAFFEQAAKPDPWPNQFAKAVRARQEAVVERLKEIEGKTVSNKQAFDADIAPLISAALGSLMHDHEDPAEFTFPIPIRYLGAENQPFCDAMSDLMTHSGTLLLAYDELARRDTQKSRLEEVEASFKKDKGVTESTIEAGKKVAITDIERLLVDRFNEVRLPQDLTGEEEHKGRLLLSRGMDKESQSKQSLGWGNLARDAMTAIGNLCDAGELDEGRR